MNVSYVKLEVMKETAVSRLRFVVTCVTLMARLSRSDK